MKKYCILVLLIALLVTACSQQKVKETESTKDTSATNTKTSAESEEFIDSYYAMLEEETAAPPTVADDLNYYEMYQKAKEEELEYIRKHPDSSGWNVYAEHGSQYVKEWKSTDGKISFVLDTELGPYAQYSSPFEFSPKYTVNGKDYTNTEIELNSNSVYEDTCFNMIKWSPDVKCTIILSGPFEYDHDKQSFTVTADSAILYAPDVPGVRYSEAEKMTVDEWNERYGDPDVPYYHEGEKVTFKMVR